MSQRNKKNNGKTSLPESDTNVVPASNISQAPIVNLTTTLVPPSPPKEEILPDPALVGKEEILPAIPALEPEERDPDGEPTKEEEEAADINDYKSLNKLWKGNKLKDVYFGQQASLDRKGKKKYVAEQKLKPKTPEQPASMLPRQSLSVHRFLQYCNSDKAGNENKSIFLWHNVGSGKTFTSLIIALNSLDLFDPSVPKYSKKKQIVVVAPGGIFVNFENELKEKLNVKIKAELSADEKKNSPLENTEGFNDCTWTVNGKTSRSFKLIGYRYSAIVKYIKNNMDTYVNPLKNLFDNSVVIFDECHRLFRPVEPLIPTAEYFIDNGLLQNSMRCILMTGTPFNTSTTDMITMLTFMKCAVLKPEVDKKCSRIYPIEFISKTPRPTGMKEIVSTSSFGILCSILNFFPGGSILLAANNWPNKIKAYMAILHEDWLAKGLTVEQGILELLGREMKSETLTPGLFDGINIDNKPNEGFAFANIENLWKGLGFDKEVEDTIKETCNKLFQGSTSFIKIELSEIKKYQGNYGAICELVDIINEEVTSLNLTTDENIIVLAKIYRSINQKNS